MGKEKPKNKAKKSVPKKRWDWLFWLIVGALAFVIAMAVYDSGRSATPNTAQQNTTGQPASSQPSASDSAKANALNDVKVQVNGKDAQGALGDKVKIHVNGADKQDASGSEKTTDKQ